MFQELVDEFQYHENISLVKIDVDDCDDVTEEFGITALPSFVIVERTIHGSNKMAKNTILNRFIGKNSPNLAKNEAIKWLVSVDGQFGNDYSNITKADMGQEEHVTKDKMNTSGNQAGFNTNTVGINRKKKKSFTSLILRESSIESEIQK